MKRVFLIDAMSHIYRAFFAPMGMKQEPLRNSKGQVTQAVFVFTNMLRKLINDEKPDYIAAIFESEEKTFRHEMSADYKANRAKMPDDLTSQIPFILRVCEAFCIPIISSEGFEADDVIGTLAQQIAKKGMQAVIVSNDKDLCQLVRDPHVIAMRNNSSSVKRKVPVPSVEWCDEAWVIDKFGVPPEKIVDLLGLMGDAVDNIPGAPGVGAKGALKIVEDWGSALNAMEHADDITHKTYRESLKNNQEIIKQSLELATIHCEVPVILDLDALKHCDPDRQKAYELFRELEFKTLTNEFARSAAGTSSPLFTGSTGHGKVETKYSIVKDRESLDSVVRRLFEIDGWSYAVRSKTEKASCFNKEAPIGIAFGIGSGEAFYIDLENFEGGLDAALRPIRDVLTNPFMGKCAYDAKRNLGPLMTIEAYPAPLRDDVLVAAYLLDSTRSSYPVDFLAQAYLDVDLAPAPPEGFDETVFRLTEQADLTARLAPVLRKQLRDNELEKIYDEIELPLIPVLVEIELNGMKVDVDSLKTFSDFIGRELEGLSAKIFAIAGREFKINSPKQVGEVFADLNIATGRKTSTGQISTSHDVLVELAATYDIAQHVIDFRELDKLRATYADALPRMIAEDGRIHGCLNQTVAATGRLSSTEPNLQNIPIRTELGQRIRTAFIPEDGWKLISADYSQLELRILAHVTQDTRMLEAYKNHEDIHAQTARLVFGATDEKDLKEKRRLAKIVNFAIAYAVEAFGLSTRVGLSRAEAKKVIEDYFETYKGIRDYMDKIPQTAREQGYITSLLGRRRYFPSINDRNFSVRGRAEREAINMPIQGTASDIVKIAMIRVHEALQAEGLETKMIMQIHDELLFEAPAKEVKKAVEIIKREMEAATQLDVPLVVEVGSGDDWMHAK